MDLTLILHLSSVAQEVTPSLPPDHPIHPPQMEGDPWDCEVLPNNGYSIQLKKVSTWGCPHH